VRHEPHMGATFFMACTSVAGGSRVFSANNQAMFMAHDVGLV
jgi:hypothetical protein